MQALLSSLGQLLSPIGTVFHYVFYEPVYNILMVLYQAFHVFLPAGGFALSIVVLTLILRACLIPLTRKQLKSSRAMQELQPRLKQLQAQYKNNPQELMAAQQALYKEHGVNPVSGCLPLLVQMPFIYALYYSFFAALQTQKVTSASGQQVLETSAHHLMRINADLYPFVPHLTHLPDTAFFWTSLATPDPTHILPVIAAVLTFLQLRMALPVRKPAPAGQKDSMSQATGMMQYIMPFFTLFIGLSFPAGLALYWCVSTLFSAVQQYFLTGVGSLFVGIPGLEHLVPEPKEITSTTTPAKSVSAGSPRSTRGLPAPAAALAPEPSTGGLRGMLRQMKEQMAAVQQNAVEAQKAKQNGTSANTQNAAKTATGTVVDADEPFAVAPKSPTISRQNPRPRPPKTGPVLVKPPTATTNTQNAAKTATAGENAPATSDASGTREATAESAPAAEVSLTNGNGKNGNRAGSPLRTDVGAQPAAPAGGAVSSSGKNGNSTPSVYKTNSGKNGNIPAAAGARTGAAASNGPNGRSASTSAAGNRSGAQRKPSGNNGNSGNKGSQSARPRPSGRPKGGR